MTTSVAGWPATVDELVAAQVALATATPPPWAPAEGPVRIGGVWFAAPTGSAGDGAGEPAWAAAVTLGDGHVEAVVRGRTGAGYVAGRLALREGPLLEAAVAALPALPEVLLVNATGRDHPLGAGLALHLGAVLDVPTVGVTDRPLVAEGPEPAAVRWATAPLLRSGEVVASWLRTRVGVRALVVHPAWRTDLPAAVVVVRASVARARTPEPLRLARRVARLARARDEGRLAVA
jgi:deoxyribonuclease V